MRCLNRNKVSFSYALYDNKTSLVDEYGNQTGEYRVIYQTPVLTKGNVSWAKGDAQIEIFGVNLVYERVIMIDDVNCPIDENSLIFLNVAPILTEAGYNNDYTVKAVAKSLNSVSIAIAKAKTV